MQNANTPPTPGLDPSPELGEMVLRCLIRSHGDNRMMIVGSVATTTALPPGDYSLTLHLERKILGERWIRAEHLLSVPDGMIPPGMRPNDLLCSDIDLSPESIARFLLAHPNTERDHAKR